MRAGPGSRRLKRGDRRGRDRETERRRETKRARQRDGGSNRPDRPPRGQGSVVFGFAFSASLGGSSLEYGPSADETDPAFHLGGSLLPAPRFIVIETLFVVSVLMLMQKFWTV